MQPASNEAVACELFKQAQKDKTLPPNMTTVLNQYILSFPILYATHPFLSLVFLSSEALTLLPSSQQTSVANLLFGRI
jgi:hypothetical protein